MKKVEIIGADEQVIDRLVAAGVCKEHSGALPR